MPKSLPVVVKDDLEKCRSAAIAAAEPWQHTAAVPREESGQVLPDHSCGVRLILHGYRSRRRCRSRSRLALPHQL
jgi:hypothetical protein